jgi:hypothetical protein
MTRRQSCPTFLFNSFVLPSHDLLAASKDVVAHDVPYHISLFFLVRSLQLGTARRLIFQNLLSDYAEQIDGQ